jgi:hypothetical protein
VTLLADGNDVLGAAGAALAGTPTESLVVAQTIDGAFGAPPAPGSSAHWPSFPAPAGAVAPAGPLPINLRDGFNATATFRDDGDPATANVDVIVTLSGLPRCAIRCACVARGCPSQPSPYPVKRDWRWTWWSSSARARRASTAT